MSLLMEMVRRVNQLRAECPEAQEVEVDHETWTLIWWASLGQARNDFEGPRPPMPYDQLAFMGIRIVNKG